MDLRQKLFGGGDVSGAAGLLHVLEQGREAARPGISRRALGCVGGVVRKRGITVDQWVNWATAHIAAKAPGLP